jgi:hypothetical protein
MYLNNWTDSDNFANKQPLVIIDYTETSLL